MGPKPKPIKAPNSVWDVNENDVDSDDTVEWRKKSVMATAAKRKSFINYDAGFKAPPKIRGIEQKKKFEGRRKSVFDDSSSDESESDDGRRLTVNLGNARNAS